MGCGCKQKKLAECDQPSDVGDRLSDIIKNDVAVQLIGRINPNCGCREFAKKMNKWGVRGCENRYEDIIAHLVKQAQHQTHIGTIAGKLSLLSYVGLDLERKVAEKIDAKARQWLDKAISDAKRVDALRADLNKQKPQAIRDNLQKWIDRILSIQPERRPQDVRDALLITADRLEGA